MVCDSFVGVVSFVVEMSAYRSALYHHVVVTEWKCNNNDRILAMVVGVERLLLLPFAIVGNLRF